MAGDEVTPKRVGWTGVDHGVPRERQAVAALRIARSITADRWCLVAPGDAAHGATAVPAAERSRWRTGSPVSHRLTLPDIW